MIPKLMQWFMSAECRALDNPDFYSEHYWMIVDDVEMDEDDMDMVSNEPNSTAVENSNFQLLTPSSSSDDGTEHFPPWWNVLSVTNPTSIDDAFGLQ